MGLDVLEDQYVFIGGVGRSGTSIVRKLLAANHTVAAFPFEYRFIIDPDGIVDYLTASTNNWSPYIADKRLKRLEKLLLGLGRKKKIPHFVGEIIRSSNVFRRYISADAYHGWELEEHFPNYFKHVETLLVELCEFQFSATWAGAESFKVNNIVKYSPPREVSDVYLIFSRFLLSLFHGLLEECGKKILVEDNTWNLLFVDPLSRLFPNSRFIHVYRDPRDVVCSYREQRWMPSDLSQSAIICRDLYLQILNNLSSMSDQKILSVSLEELVNNQKQTVLSLASFCGIDEVEPMLQFPLSNESIGRWKKELTKSELIELEPILKDITERLGYAW